MLLKITNFQKQVEIATCNKIFLMRFVFVWIAILSSILTFGQETTFYIKNMDGKLFYVSIDTVRQAIFPRAEFQIIKIPRNVKKLAVTDELSRTKEITIDTAYKENKYYEVIVTSSSLNLVPSNKTWITINSINKPVEVFKPSAYNATSNKKRKLCELQYNSIELMYFKASQIQSEEERLAFILKNIGQHCLKVDNILYFSQLFNSENIKLSWLQSIYLQANDPANFRDLSIIFNTPAYIENFHVWLNQITDK